MATPSTRPGDVNGPELAEKAAGKAREIKQEYAHGEDKPMGSHLTLVVIYNALIGAFFLWRARSNRSFPERIGAGDVLLAQFIAAHLAGRTAEDALKLAVAAGAASTLQVGAGNFDPREAGRLLSSVEIDELSPVA